MHKLVSAFVFSTVFLFATFTLGSEHSLFSSSEPIKIKIKAPFIEAFDKAKVGTKLPYKDWQSGRDLSAFKLNRGKEVSYWDSERKVWIDLDAELEVRGKSSLNHVLFPKLHLKITDSESVRSVFQDSVTRSKKGKRRVKIKIGTHLDDQVDRKGKLLTRAKGFAGFSRLMNENAPYREAFLYEMLHLFKIPSSLSRVAEVTYIASDFQGESKHMASAEVTRKAFLFEHRKTMADRLSLEFLAKETDQAKSSEIRLLTGSYGDYYQLVDRVLVLKTMYFNALIGNFDYRLPLYEHGHYSEDRIHNVYLFRSSDGGWVPTPFDFDLSSFVTGRPSTPRKAVGKVRGKKTIESVLKVRLAWINRELSQLSLSGSERSQLQKAALRDFVLAKKRVYRALGDSKIDPIGKKIAIDHLDAFYESVE